MKKVLSMLLVLCLLVLLPMTTAAAESDMSFAVELSVDGKDSKQVETGDIITVVVKLKRTDASEPYTMYAMQNEIRYDSEFFELVEGSTILNQGVVTNDIAMVDRYRELYMNFLSMGGGTQWKADTMVGSFQLLVTGTHGTTRITNQDYLVSTQDGSQSYDCQAQDVTIVLSSDCVVTFDTNGGTEVPETVVEYGKLMAAPADPVKDGYYLEGWYKDIHLTEKWDFEQDTVESNMTLYAKWAEGVPETAENAGSNNTIKLVAIIAGMLVAAGAVVFLLRKLRTPKKKGKFSK